jgi:hypothetical protein
MTILALPTYLPIPEAARKYGLDEARIVAEVEHGRIKAAMIGDTLVIAEDDARQEARPLRKEDLPEYQKFSNLDGIGIGIGEASEKYNIGFATVFRWFKKGLISEIERTTVQGGEKIFLNERDVAYCVEIHRKIGGQGRKIFDKKGMPVKPKTGSLAL